ncbi:MAG: hypothetical protein J6568_02335 [Snodgrassella sp.]|jgi:hypothetical protein|nr:hypothetical protein [Snodgrassella sp.]
MSNLKPGDNTGINGGIYQEVDPHGHAIENFATTKDHEKLPPTQHAGNSWKLINRTPDSKH